MKFAADGERGIRATVLPPGKYALNTDAFTVTEMWTTQMIAHYTSGATVNPQSKKTEVSNSTGEEKEITVRTSDGFTFPVDVRVEYLVTPADAPLVIAKLGDDEGDRFRNALNSAVRAIFRNNAESVRALDYVQERSQQETQSLTMLRSQMARFGVTVTAVRIGNVGDEESLGALLKTQTDREIAKQEQQTFQEQQKAATQKKELTRVTQEAEEEKKLATATYEVKIADESQKKKVIEAKAEAEATKIKATAQAEAYKQIAEQIGKSNAALIELLKIVGEKGIEITPRIMVTGKDEGGMGSALMGTILDRVTSDDDGPKPAATKPPAKP
jgi:regulator of protease activity HflC (stomatin/prohibitin superfamily)